MKNTVLTTVLFDVDNTLYDAHCGVESAMNSRINEFVSDYLGISRNEVVEKRKQSIPEYGTTLRWLQVCHGLEESSAYMEYVHPKNIDSYLQENPALRKMLEKMPYRLEILTNGPEFHARRVLKALGVNDLFPHLYALEWLGFEGKPYTAAYEKVLAHMGEKASSVLFLDDKEINLEAFSRLGGHGLLVGPDKGSGKFPWIRDILDLEKMLPA
ncbi:HAD family hydrolase [Oceanispirochaeta crateris]|uniref:HAD family hydrolase n=1 Tax=Oceanispirochaeta crateris TaxID=2518645 RepID=A0A5C1QJW2_9SPIO|nr:HAD-IA family hydrolase [Oceanispirochaeta crateris]QEN08415.1 HAD family hydrolase [Oceanispirochaeta crateris]